MTTPASTDDLVARRLASGWIIQYFDKTIDGDPVNWPWYVVDTIHGMAWIFEGRAEALAFYLDRASREGEGS